MAVGASQWGRRDPEWRGAGSYAGAFGASDGVGDGQAGAVLSRPWHVSSNDAVTTDDQTQSYDPFAPEPGPAPPDGVWDQLDRLPTIHDQPVVWDHRQGGFVPGDPNAPTAVSPAASTRSQPPPPPAPDDVSPVGWQRGSSPGAGPAPASSPAAPPAARRAPAGRPPGGPPPAGRAPSPRPAPAPVPARRPRSRARLVRRILVGLLALVVLLAGGLFAFGWWEFNKIPKVDVAKVLSPPSPTGTNYLIVGTDSRDGISASDPNAGAFLGPGDPGDSTRTDSILILRMQGDQSSLLSIPRDLWVKNPDTGSMGRINSVYQSGPSALIKAVQNLGIPVQHYMEINFVSFGSLVDAVGGITVDFDTPARDLHSGLKIDTAGPVRLDGVQGLAYVRSRYYEKLINGKWTIDPTSDLGRVMRQRAFLSALLHEVANSKNPFTVARVASSLSGGLKIDNTLSYFDALGLVWQLRSFSPAGNTIPTDPTTVGGAAVLKLNGQSAGVIAQYK
jgi:LCP family protein required for cell wall assembly